MNKIKSFQVDHRKLNKGIYISRIDGDIVTYDLRFCKPNSGEVLDNVTMHTIEHMLATFARNSSVSGEVIYFGPMGCQTGFYLLVRKSVSYDEVLALVKETLRQTIDHTGAVFGASEIECGNYKTLDLANAKKACREYLEILNGVDGIVDYDYINSTSI